MLIGIVNNMPEEAARATERQFLQLLAASVGRPIEVRLFRGPEMRRLPDDGGPRYDDIRELDGAHPDALIVTGAEPTAATLPEEPSWASVTWAADWAEANAVPAIWSCLAAHALVQYLDGVVRCRQAQKIFGVFACDRVAAADPLMSGVACRWAMPHSRWNGLPEADLRACGYKIVSRSDEAGVDIFLKRRAASFLCLQGHPEYGPDTLRREYVRDVRRYATGKQEAYPNPPRNAFDPDTEASLEVIRQRAVAAGRNERCLDEVNSALQGAVHSSPWREPAARICANWLSETVLGETPSPAKLPYPPAQSPEPHFASATA